MLGLPIPGTATPAVDERGRTLRDLRISITDRCNFRCRYCMPREQFGADHAFLARSALLDFDEIVHIATAAVTLGVRKVRLTGGEPLMRPGVVDLVSKLAAIPGLDLAMTTNGVLLPRFAHALAAAGLRRVTVSLDSTDDVTFGRMSDTRHTVDDVLEGIGAAQSAGLGPVKINTVIKRGVNDADIPHLAARFKGSGHIVRFIEYMDVGTTNGWNRTEVMPAQEIFNSIDRMAPLDPVPPSYSGEVASRYRYRDGTGEVGIISSVSDPFCGSCTRARLSAEGTLYTCLFASSGLDLRSILRGPRTTGDLVDAIDNTWSGRVDRYSELRGQHENTDPKIEMSYIGG